MRNIFILYMPPGNHEAMVHYEDTIRRRVEPDRIYRHVPPAQTRRLQGVFGKHRIAVWGSRDSAQNRSKFDRMRPGDEVLIVEGPEVKLLARVADKCFAPSLARELWQNLDGNDSRGWDLVYFLANPREINLPFAAVKRLLDYKETFTLRGFTAVAESKLDEFYARYDDIYSILMAIREGREVRQIPDGFDDLYREPEGALDDAAVADPAADEEPEPKERNTEDHVLMQWILLKLGRQAGEKVWAPRGDQSRIARSHQFQDFETEFAGGLDTQTKYIENIDVVWKQEFRIDAAFEVENSTSIYSGLLRFADLTVVAPNSNYPLFVVSPSERRNRVREQLLRPSFKNLDLPRKVRFLSYEKVREVDEFVGPDGRGFNVDLLIGKSEQLTG